LTTQCRATQITQQGKIVAFALLVKKIAKEG